MNPSEDGPCEDRVADLGVIERRAEGISDWLKENGRGCFDEQKHLDQDTQERIYWHYGYLVALRDVYRNLTGQRMPSQARRSRRRDNHVSGSSAWPDG